MNEMMGKLTIKFVAAVQIVALTLLAACSAAGVSAVPDSSNVCHASGDASNPYQAITVTSAELNQYLLDNPHDISPVPAGGCPAYPLTVANGEITFCHANGSATEPYDEITVSVNGLNGHGQHEGDIFPMPEGGCPATVVATAVVAATVPVGSDALTVCHATGDTTTPYEAVTVENVDLLNEHLAHPGDFSPVPVSGCPSSLIVISDGQTTICHASGDATTPYEAVVVSVNGLDGHGLHEGDVFPLAGQEGCPATLPLTNGTITICHATGSAKNPYVKITISIDGLNGHNKHSGDIIPAPAGGCPATRP